jgi:hypothetical protein
MSGGFGTTMHAVKQRIMIGFGMRVSELQPGGVCQMFLVGILSFRYKCISFSLRNKKIS